MLMIPINPTLKVERGFYVAGLLAAHSILYLKTLAINFNPCFLKLVLQRSLALSDLQVCETYNL